MATSSKVHKVYPADLPLACPMPKQAVWNAHPKIYLPIEANGHAECPYCGKKYTLETTEHPTNDQ